VQRSTHVRKVLGYLDEKRAGMLERLLAGGEALVPTRG
jgi:hypothetical protein